MKKGIPKPFAIEDIRLRLCFTAPSYRIFKALVIGWVLTTGTHTISQVILTSRGRNADYPAPPAQIRTGGITAYGSYLGCMA